VDLFLKAIILGVVEGLTEFLPVSSTGHMILVNEFVQLEHSFATMFEVVIQLGAILSVVLYFWPKLSAVFSVDLVKRAECRGLWIRAIIGVFPALAIGALAGDFVEERLFNPMVVAIALAFWGIVLIVLESRQRKPSITSVAELPIKIVLGIGLIQCLAMVPGTSRSAATIVGAMLLGASRGVAAEFSFFLAIPTMAAASAYTLLKSGLNYSSDQWLALGIGFVTAFLVAWATIAFLMRYIQTRDFRPFGYYRVALGVLVAAFFLWVR